MVREVISERTAAVLGHKKAFIGFMDLVQSVKDLDRFDLLFDTVRQKAAADLNLSVDRGMAPLSIAWGGPLGGVYSIENDLDAFRTLPVSVMVERVMTRIRAWKEDRGR